MSQSSPNLALPYLMPAQAQKHVTHNEALAILDLLVQTVVEAVAETPPAAPSGGQAWLLGAAPTAAWAGHPDELAQWRDGGWVFVAPRPGWRLWDRAAALLRIWSGTEWVPLAESFDPASLDLQNLPHLGINASADAINRLSVAAPATLLNHEGAGHQLKLNKAAAADTGSVLFQTGFSGRAEMGLTGSNAFTVKTSADGTAWKTALRADPPTGIVSAPQGFDSLRFDVPYEGVVAVPTPSAGGFVFLSLVEVAYPQAPANAILVYDTGSSPLLVTVWLGASVTNYGTGTLTGTTGAAGKVSVAAKADGKLYVENRFAAGTTQFCATFINGFRGL